MTLHYSIAMDNNILPNALNIPFDFGAILSFYGACCYTHTLFPYVYMCYTVNSFSISASVHRNVRHLKSNNIECEEITAKMCTETTSFQFLVCLCMKRIHRYNSD